MSKGVKQFKGALSCFAKDIIKQFKEQTSFIDGDKLGYIADDFVNV